jgi:hypothetical protein
MSIFAVFAAAEESPGDRVISFDEPMILLISLGIISRSPGDSSAAANTANIDIISVRKTRKNLFSNVMTPFFIKTGIFF